jgi:hypothetical protein
MKIRVASEMSTVEHPQLLTSLGKQENEEEHVGQIFAGVVKLGISTLSMVLSTWFCFY